LIINDQRETRVPILSISYFSIMLSVEPRIVYLTEKGIDLLALWPDIQYMDRAMRNGVSWFDLNLHATNPVKIPPYKIVKTTEAELAAMRQQEKAQAIQETCDRLLSAIKEFQKEERTVDRLVDYIARACYGLSADLRFDVADMLCVKVYEHNLIYTPPPAVAPVTPPRKQKQQTAPGAPQRAPRAPQRAPCAPISRHKKHLEWILDSLSKNPSTPTAVATVIKPLRMPKLKSEWLMNTCVN
jgi:hypothetical protein